MDQQFEDFGVQAVADLDGLSGKEKRIKPTSLFQEQFDCKICEERCVIKDKNEVLQQQVKNLLQQLHDKQTELEEFRTEFYDKLVNEVGVEKLQKAAMKAKESELVKEKDRLIKTRDDQISSMTDEIAALKQTIQELQDEKQQFMKTGYEADIEFEKKYKEYIGLVKKHDWLLTKIATLEAEFTKLKSSINDKSLYEHELANKINSELLPVINTLQGEVARLRVEKNKLTKVKPVTKEPKKGGFSLFGKNGSKDRQ